MKQAGTFPKQTRMIDGILVVNKSMGLTSHDVVQNVRRKFRMQQVGHAGKLDPLARKGIVIERQARPIKIHSLELKEFDPPQVRFYLECSKGTYVRQLAEDVGKKLGCGACITQIERTKVGPFHIAEAVNLEEIDERHIRNWKV